MNQIKVPVTDSADSPLSGLMELLSDWTDDLSPDGFDDESLEDIEIEPLSSPAPRKDISSLLDALVDDQPQSIATAPESPQLQPEAKTEPETSPKPSANLPQSQSEQPKQSDQISGLLNILSGWAIPENADPSQLGAGQNLSKDGVSTLQNLLVGPFATQLRRDLDRVDATVGGMEQQLADLGQQVANTSALAESLMPMISDLIDRKFAQLKAEILASVIEAVDEQEQSISIKVSGISDRPKI
ncbi:hypothetical protein Pse7367_0822 [Thalassoporum mexicanum PCC 7367]|uniref:hypothetical protein n=1 Tax=Thalassoporum mexicanum TaxID=3457544 RepID=UPI00029FAF7D|nr:hypothetical protein [Pseudanabaena sp. PCC 7367]AFY69122.1 hypothetical protein Pse7367_0822 [Pseudanabaena sp. PCC 7367]